MTCNDCLHFTVCEALAQGNGIPKVSPTYCSCFEYKERFAEIVRCKDCVHAEELDKHCDISRTAYRHCGLLRGDETKYVWHKYKKYYKDYSLVELDGYCDEGVLKEREGK